MSQKKHRKKRRKANPPKTTHVIEHSPDTLPDTASVPPSEDTGLSQERSAEKRVVVKQTADSRTFEKRSAEKQAADTRAFEKRSAEKQAAEKAVPFIPEERSAFSQGRLIRLALTLAGAAVCLLVIMYFNARMAGFYPGAGILSSLRGKNAETYSAAPEESPSSADTVKAPAAENEAESQQAVTMSENAAVEKTGNSNSDTAKTAEEADAESEEEAEDEEYYEEEEYEYEYEDEEEEYEYEEEYVYEEEEEYEEGELIDDFD